MERMKELKHENDTPRFTTNDPRQGGKDTCLTLCPASPDMEQID
jgi:hypothetical protein